MNQGQFNDMLRAAIAQGLLPSSGFVNPATADLNMASLYDINNLADLTFIPQFGGPNSYRMRSSSAGFNIYDATNGSNVYEIRTDSREAVFYDGVLGTEMAALGRGYIRFTNAAGSHVGKLQIAAGGQISFDLDGSPLGGAIADAAGGATIDAEARTALNALLARMRLMRIVT